MAHWRAQWRSSAVAQWRSGAVDRASDSRLRTRVRILRCGVEPCESSFTRFCSSSLSSMHEYMAIDSVGYLCTNIHRVLIAAWLDVYQRSRDGVRLNMSARG